MAHISELGRFPHTVEAQFLIEGECPEPGDVQTSLTEYPVAVFVEWPPVGAEALENCEAFHACSSLRYYRVLDEGVRRLGLPWCDRGWYLCEHMGHLIE